MREAAYAFVEYKFADGAGTMRDGGASTGWLDGAGIQARIPRYPDHTVGAAASYCQYIYDRYGRVPAMCGPFRTVLAYQAHQLDSDFYDRLYKPDVLAPAQRLNTEP